MAQTSRVPTRFNSGTIDFPSEKKIYFRADCGFFFSVVVEVEIVHPFENGGIRNICTGLRVRTYALRMYVCFKRYVCLLYVVSLLK